MGGDHGDVELRPEDGPAAARYLVEHYPAQVLFDLSLLVPAEQHEFAFGFATALFHDNRRAMHVFVDECDEFMPQFPADKVERSCLGAFDRLVRRGRIRGIGLTAITQRSAVMSKNVLTQVGSLLVLRTGSPQDLLAVEGWVERVMEKEEVKKFLSALPRLRTGRAWYVCPGRRPVTERVSIRRRRTYDSSRTPEMGEDVRDPPLLPVDATALRQWLDDARARQVAEGDESEEGRELS